MSISVLLCALVAPAEAAERSVPTLQRQIRRAVDRGDHASAVRNLRRLSEIGTERSTATLFELGIAIQVPEIYREVIQLLANLKDEESRKFFRSQAAGKREVRMIFLADVLARMEHESALEILAILSGHPRGPVLRAAVFALGRQRARGSVDPLLRVLERLESRKDRGQIYQEVRDALFLVTGQDHDNARDWRKWWDDNRVTFDPGKARGSAARVRPTPRERAPEFAGKKIFGRNIVLVMDTSESMRFTMMGDIPGLIRSDPFNPAGAATKSEETLAREGQILARFWSRLEMARRALIGAIVDFDTRIRFNLIEFNDQVNPMAKSGLVPARPGMRNKAINWARRLKWTPGGNTGSLEALEMALLMDPAVTEIYFLSDGPPPGGGETEISTGKILDRIDSLNRFRKVKIHTFGFDPRIHREDTEQPELVEANRFLGKLATSTGGTFTLLVVNERLRPPPDFRFIGR